MQSIRETNQAFDLWLSRSLAAQYASTLSEDVPNELLALLGGAPALADPAADAALLHHARGYVGSC